MGRLGPKERRFLAEILFGFITRDYQRTAQIHFDAGYVPRASFGRELRAGDPRHRRTDPQPRRRRHLDGQAVDAAVRGHRPVRHAHAARSCCCCKRPWWWWKASPARSIPSSTCGPWPIPSCANGSSAISGRPGGWKTSPRAPARSAASSARCRRCLSARATLIDQLDDITRDGLVLSPETVEAIGRAEQRRNRWTAVALWAIAALLACGGVAVDVQPPLHLSPRCGEREIDRVTNSSQLVDALRPARLHAGEHLRRDRHQADHVRRHRQRGLAALLAQRDGGLAFQQMIAVFVDGDVAEHQPLGRHDLAEHALHRIVVAVRSVHDDAQGAADAQVAVPAPNW